MGSRNTMIVLVLVNFIGLVSSTKSSSVVPIGFRATIFHRGYYNLSASGEHYYGMMINHSISRLHNFGNALTYKNDPIGYIFSGTMDYIIQIGIGSPPVAFNLNIDTGSRITWVQHKNCETCIDKDGPTYDDKNSASAIQISCDQPECDYDEMITCNEDSNKCSYSLDYDDGSTSEGLMFLDSFIFSSVHQRSAVVLDRVKLGGGLKSTKGAYHPSLQGIFGLNRNRRSFISERGFKKFSYCLPNHKDMIEDPSMVVASNMMFGTEASLIGTGTAMIPNEELYIVNIKGIIVKGVLVWVDPSQVGPYRQIYTIVDTGTPISFVPKEAYNEIRRNLISIINLPRKAYGNANSLCFWGGLTDIDKYAPEMKLHFDGLDVTIIPRSVFFMIPDREAFCLAMMPMEERDQFSIFGAILQQNLNIGFDLDENKIFIAPLTCASIV